MRYKLEGLDCANCAAKIEKELRKIEGLEGIAVNMATQIIDVPPETVERIMAVLDRIDPGVTLKPALQSETSGEDEKAPSLIALIVAGVIFSIGLIFHDFLHQTLYAWLEYALLIPAYVTVGWPVLRGAYENIRRHQWFDENFLMTVATFGAIALHQLTEAVGVMLFYAVGLYLEAKAVARSRRSITALLDIQPGVAHRVQDGEILQVKPEEVLVGDTIVIKPGEKVPLDGEVLEGESFLDTSALTGESTPRRIMPGERVLAGMINGQGLLTVKVTKMYEQSAIARILHLVEKAQERKASTEQFITAFAKYYSPLVVGLAFLIAVVPPLVSGASFKEWLYRALVLLVISCPCALMVSIPLGYFGGIGGASRRGLLVKGANFLDVLAKLHTVVFDKTGTLTHGVFRVARVVPENGWTEKELLSAVVAAERYSNHPIADSIREAYGDAFPVEPVEDYREIPAHGITAVVNGRRVLAGNARLMQQERIAYSQPDEAGTSVHVAVDGQYAGYLLIADQVKADAADAVRQLRSLGIRRIYMLTGDTEEVAAHVAAQLGLDGYYAGLLPEEKVERLEMLLADLPRPEKQKLAFVGDGVNDAPVIARADLGVAMGGLGSDAAIEAADLVLMEDQPSKLASAVSIARRTQGIVWQNICLALGIKLIFILLGAVGETGIWEAVFADVGVTLLAILNSMRAQRVPAS